MAEPVREASPARPLRVAVCAGDEQRRAALAAIVERMGYEIAEAGDADVVLADADSGQIETVLKAIQKRIFADSNDDSATHFAGPDEEDSGPLLTPRELEVLVAISDGLSNKAVARRFEISQHTVKFHVESIFRKLGVATRAEAVAKGLRRGLVHL
jgi:DNA-binding NarL/FixJ family response regulator